MSLIWVILVLVADKYFEEKCLVSHLLSLTRLYNAQILFSQRKIHFGVRHRWYLHNLFEASKKLCILLLRTSVAIYLSFFITKVPLFTCMIVISTCCLKLSFSSSKLPRCFWKEALLTWIWSDEIELTFPLKIILLGLF